MNVKTLAFEGASDDGVIVYEDGKAIEEYDAYNGIALHLESPAESLRLTFALSRDTGCWEIGFGPTSEASAVPTWPVTIGAGGRDYTGRLTVTVPDDTQIRDVTG